MTARNPHSRRLRAARVREARFARLMPSRVGQGRSWDSIATRAAPAGTVEVESEATPNATGPRRRARPVRRPRPTPTLHQAWVVLPTTALLASMAGLFVEVACSAVGVGFGALLARGARRRRRRRPAPTAKKRKKKSVAMKAVPRRRRRARSC